MASNLSDTIALLERTPAALNALLRDLPNSWTSRNEGDGTFTVSDVIGHLIHGDRTNWMPRVEHILKYGDTVVFPAFDREAMFSTSKGRTLGELLDDFEQARAHSLTRLRTLALTDGDLERCGRHPEFGVVTMREHLATWVAHDLGHISQIVRVMARQYTDAVGPWRAYLSILNSGRP